MKPKPLSPGYSVEIDEANSAAWHALVATFSDGNVYQLWHKRALADGARDASRLIIRNQGEIVAAAEVRLFLVPIIRRGIAYVRWGPLWRVRGRAQDFENLRQAIRALRNEFVSRRGMILRIVPRLFVEDAQAFAAILTDEEFTIQPDGSPSRSLVMDIACDLDDIRKGFDRKWRNQLTKAEKAGLTITSGSSLELIDEFALVYQEMLQRKQFVPSADLQRHRSIQTLLPPDLQMGIVLARHEGRPCAGAIYSALGDTAVYLFGATNDSGMRTCGSYLVQWEVLKLLKERATTYYDLHGINPEANPGTYHFKQGLAGKRGRQVTFVGQFQAFQPSIVNSALLLGGRLRQQARTSRAGLSNGRPNPRTETSTSPGSKAALPSSEADAP